tara:strand:+ start:420 stop:737 length:318 start_codon:yes stop_codon:yes gene_type:complete
LKNSVSNQDFKQLLFHTKSLYIRDLVFYYRAHQKHGVSFIVGRNKGNAILRNTFKRRCRAIVRQNKQLKLKKIQLIIKPTKNLKNNYSWQELNLSFDKFFIKLEL